VADEADSTQTQAAIWLARIERGLEPHEGAQLRAWLLEPAHRDTIVNIAKLYHGPDIVAVLAELVPVGFGNPPPPKYKRSRTSAMIVGATLAVIVAFVPFMAIIGHTGLFGTHMKVSPAALPPDQEIYDTGPGKTRTVRLPDGSQIVMNGQTQLYVLFAAWAREATVVHGEAIFEVAPERPSKPFRVFAGGRHFEAPASRFDLHVTAPQSVELTVLDGSVTVKGLPFRWPTSPYEARNFNPALFDDSVEQPLQAVQLDDQSLNRRVLTAADIRSRLSWEPERVVYVTP